MPSVCRKCKQKRPEPQFKMLDNIPRHELSDHLIVAHADGYQEWHITVGRIRERRTQHTVDGRTVIDIESYPETVHLLVWWEECDCDVDH